MTKLQIVLSDEQANSLEKSVVEVITKSLEYGNSKWASKEWLRKGECAEHMGIARTTLDSWIKKGLKVSVVQGVQLISKQALNEFLQEHQQ